MAANPTTGPGEVRVLPGVVLNAGEDRRRLVIVNTGDRPVQIGSHIHLPDVNAALSFDRDAAAGFRLDIPSGTSRRFEPGASREVDLVACAVEPASPASRSRGRDVQMDRAAYAALYGPTTGDQVRLGDTDLWIEVEQDLTFGGEEAVFGGGKSIRESMAQSTVTRADGALDTVITNALVLDHWGIVRADVGMRDGRIVALGRAATPTSPTACTPDC